MARKPNIVIFNPDQWRGDVLGHMGNEAAVTPVLDDLVTTDAVSFHNAFCQNTVCTPSRCSFMTGWYPHVRGHRTMHHMLHPESDETNLLKVLKENGYHVWWGGKNDLTPGQEDVDQYCDERFYATDEDKKRWLERYNEGAVKWPDGWRGEKSDDNYFSFYAGRLGKGTIADRFDFDWEKVFGALDFIENYKGDKPFCIYLPIQYPHPVYAVEDPWFSAADRTKIPQRAKPPENWKGKPSILKGICEGQNLEGWSEERWAELRGTYYGMCARVDHQFGMLMDRLKESNAYDDTAVFLFSDHGDFTGDYGLVEKTQNTFEDVLSRVPFVVKPPKSVPVKPRVSDAIVELVDFSETVFDLTGIEPGYDRFGKSLLPLLAGKTDELRDAAFCEGGRLKEESQSMERESLSGDAAKDADGLYWPRLKLQVDDDGPPSHTKAAMCRTKTHKYVRRHYESDELYDLQKDPLEERNVIDDPAYAGVLAELRERMLRWYMETCDVVPRNTDRR